MRKIVKWIMIGIPMVLIVGIAFISISSYMEHRELVEIEKEQYPAPGILVDVNDNGEKVHVYTEGQGDHTLVFMSGLGTSSPYYDFKVLYNKLTDEHRIAVVERAGYGWSDLTESPRDINTVLEETRKALTLSGETPPYILFPHSLSGLEAIHWANEYPEEVDAIIGLDPLVPAYALEDEVETSFSPVIDFLMRSGLVRSQPEVFTVNFPAMKKGHLSEEEAEIARTIFYRRVQTDNMKDELERVNTNAQTVSEQGQIDIPFHVFISRENEDEKWAESLVNYAEKTGGQSFILDGGHYIHLDQPELIAERSREIIRKVKDD